MGYLEVLIDVHSHLHVRMLENDRDPEHEGSGYMLFRALKSLLMMLPQSTCYYVLKDRLTGVSRFRQTAIHTRPLALASRDQDCESEVYLHRVQAVRALHCAAAWRTIRAESLEVPVVEEEKVEDEGKDRRAWLGYVSKKEHQDAQAKYRDDKQKRPGVTIEQVGGYQDLASQTPTEDTPALAENGGPEETPPSALHPPKDSAKWKRYWENTD